MRERSVRAITLVMVVALTGAVLPSGTSAQEEQRFQGIIQSTAGGRASGMTRVTIRISEFTSDEEVVRLITLLAEEGSRAVENEMVRTDVARFQLAGQRSHNFGVARRRPGPDGGEIISLVTARPLLLFEQTRWTRSRDHPFGFIQLELDAEGKGTGLVYVAASFDVNDDGQLIIESFGTAPVSISTIERQ